MIIAVSDIHVGSAESNTVDFTEFLYDVILRKDSDNITDFVLCGDIFDFWRCNMMDMMVKGNFVMAKLLYLASSDIKVHYIAGNHDYVMRNVKSDRIDFTTYVQLIDEDVCWSFLHGWEYDPVQNSRYFDALCYSNTVNTKFTQHTFKNYARFLPLARRVTAWFSGRKIRKEISDMFWHKEDVKMWIKTMDTPIGKSEFPTGGTVYGHTHVPLIDDHDNVVNCGSWVRGNPITNTYVEISGSDASVKRFM